MNRGKWLLRRAALVLGPVLVLGTPLPTLAVTIAVPTLFADADASDGAVDGVFTVVGDLTIATGGRITCNDPVAPGGASACEIAIAVSGDMEMHAGSAVLAKNKVGSGSGGDINIVVGGNLTLRGPAGAAPGATISSSDLTGGGSTGNAGDIAITVGNAGVSPPTGDFLMEPGSSIIANSANRSAGAITIKVARSADVDGLVESFGGMGGTGALQARGGGPIVIDAGCDLTVTDAGKISSRGVDPGAGLVHLEGGCVVRVFGLVESTGIGHGPPTNPPNECAGAGHPDKPANAVACVEIWAGDSLIIDAKNHAGEINADTSGSPGVSWIDLLVRGPLIVIGNTLSPFAVHANGNGGSNDVAGTVKAVSRDGDVLMSGLAIQVDATKRGGDGGVVKIEAHGLVQLDTALIFARGDFKGTGGFGIGGAIKIRSFAGNVSWTDGVGDVRPTGQDTIPPIDDNPPVGSLGVIKFKNCETGSVTITGTMFPHNGDLATTPRIVALGVPCGGSPTLKAYVLLPLCLCVSPGGVPCIEVTKLCTDATSPGGAIHFSGVVQNCGSETLDNVLVRDDAGTPGTPGDDVTVKGPLSLGPGLSSAYSGAYTPTSSPSTDTVTATGTGATSGLSTMSTASATCEVPAPGGGQGCTPGYWKKSHHFDSWLPTGYLTGQTAGSVFSSLASACPSLAATKLANALDGGGGPDFCDKVQILIRAAVAAVLNAAHPAVTYPRTVAEIVAAVNAAVGSGDPDVVIDLAGDLDAENNRGCPLN